MSQRFVIFYYLITHLFSGTLVLSAAIFPHTNSSTTRGTWTRQGLIGQGPRQEHSVASIDQDIYLIGGVHLDDLGTFETINRVEVYNVGKGTWTEAGPLPQPLNHPNVASMNGKLYLLGALAGQSNWTTVGDAYVYHTNNDTWSSIAQLPTDAWRGSSAVGAYSGKIYLAGGMTLLDWQGGVQDCLASVIAYDTKSNTWDTTLPDLPGPRQHVGGAVVNSTFFVIGGRENSIYEYRNTVYALDLDDPTEWRVMNPLPTARGSLSCSPIGTKIFCFGGEGNKESEYEIFNNTEVYDATTDTWEELGPMVVPRHGMGATTVNGQVWIPGGGPGSGPSGLLPVAILDSFAPGA